jgi:hypothetical protein
MKTSLLLTASLLAGGHVLAGRDPGSLTEIAKLKAALQAVPAITAVSSTTYEMFPGYYVVNRVTPQECPGHTIKKRVVFSGSMFRVETNMVSKNGDLLMDDELAYNNRTTQRLDRMRRLTSTWQTPNEVFDSSPSAMDQFAFLAGFVPGRPLSIKLEDLKSDAVWNQLMAKARFLGPRKVAGQDVVRFEIRDAFDPIGNISCRYEVDLSPAHGYFPLRWAAFTTHGQCFWEYRVTEFGQASHGNASYFYPLKAEGRQPGVNGQRDNPLFTFTGSSELFQIDPVSEDLFTIKPSPVR